MRLFVDLAPLRHSPPFRWLWASGLIGGVAGQVGVFAVTFQVFTLTGSSLAVGAIGLCVAIPTIGFAMVGGMLADRLDRRMLLLSASAAQLVVSIAFVVQATLRVDNLAVIYALVVLQSTIGALAVPARRATLRRLLPAEQLAPALALSLLSMHVAQVGGPALGGLVAGGASVAVCYLVQAVGVVVAIAGTAMLPPLPPLSVADATAVPSTRGAHAALRFLWSEPALRGALLVDLSVTLLAAPNALFPALNAERFGGSAETLGLLTSAVAVGGVMGTVLSGPWGQVRRSGRAVVLVAATWAATVVLLGLAADLRLALVVLVLMGVADVVALTLGQALVQNATPDELRGRVAGVEQIIQMGGPQLGGLRAGALAGALGPTATLIVGGALAIVALAGVAGSSRALWKHQERR
ncbi:MAG: MFS transporter [Rhodoglobus sp.]|nr:MFS transporter [Rhodoglobus sp.]